MGGIRWWWWMFGLSIIKSYAFVVIDLKFSYLVYLFHTKISQALFSVAFVGGGGGCNSRFSSKCFIYEIVVHSI